MRWMILEPDYLDGITAGFAARSGRTFASFEERMADAQSGGVFFGDEYPYWLRACGQEVWTCAPEVSGLQALWPGAEDIPFAAGTDAWKEEVLVRQAEAVRPDVLLVNVAVPTAARALERLRRIVPRIICQWSARLVPGYPYGRFDLLVSSLSHTVAAMRAQGWNAVHLPHAFDARWTQRFPPAPAEELVFVGRLHPEGYAARIRVLEHVARRLPLGVYGPGIELLDPSSPLHACWKGRADGAEMYRALASARVTLHVPADPLMASAGAKRLTEATGIGTALVTLTQPDLEHLFLVGEEVLAFGDADGAVAAVRELLDDEPRRRTLAAAGQARTLRERTVERRMRALVAHAAALPSRRGIFSRLLSRAGSP